MRIYAIGDIHGHREKLVAAHALIAADREAVGDDRSTVVHVGDLVDRGPDSRGVLNFLISGLDAGEPWVVLKGNHDRYLERFLSEGYVEDAALRSGLPWFDYRLGGAETMESYGLKNVHGRRLKDLHEEATEKVPGAHLDFLNSLPYWHKTQEVLFVHAGIKPGVPLGKQSEDDLIWIREPFLSDTRDHGWLVAHGHTPVDVVTHYGNHLDIDTGAGHGRALSAVVIEGRDVWLLTKAGRVPIRPLQGG